jgi:hypothetical protein
MVIFISCILNCKRILYIVWDQGVVIVVIIARNVDYGDHLVIYQSNPSSFDRLLKNLSRRDIVNDKIYVA